MGLSSKASASRHRGVRPEIETLEARLVPAITFANYGNGTFAYNDYTHQFRQITTAQAKVMDEGADGMLFASYPGMGPTRLLNGPINAGTYRYDYYANTWTQLTTAQTRVLSAAEDNTLFATYSNGTYRHNFDYGWTRITDRLATNLAAVASNKVYGAFGDGTYDGTFMYISGNWTRLTAYIATGAMEASSDYDSVGYRGTLFVSYAHGTHSWNGSGWHLLTTNVASDIAVANSYTFYASFSSGTDVGTFSWNGRFNKITSLVATNISASEGSNWFMASYIGYGTWHSRLGQVSTVEASLMA